MLKMFIKIREGIIKICDLFIPYASKIVLALTRWSLGSFFGDVSESVILD